jgi:hypothetical protein
MVKFMAYVTAPGIVGKVKTYNDFETFANTLRVFVEEAQPKDEIEFKLRNFGLGEDLKNEHELDVKKSLYDINSQIKLYLNENKFYSYTSNELSENLNLNIKSVRNKLPELVRKKELKLIIKNGKKYYQINNK